jgi:hypothetical protein
MILRRATAFFARRVTEPPGRFLMRLRHVLRDIDAGLSKGAKTKALTA